MLLGKRFNLLFILTGLVYLLLLPYRSFPFDALLKVIPICILFFAAYSQLSGKLRTLVLLGIGFCGLGDVLLNLSFTDSFTFGLGAFLVGHLFYISSFLKFANKHNFIVKILLIILVLASLVMLALQILPKTGDMLIPVASYMTVIALMGVFAILSWRKTSLQIWGALIFIISDTLIAWGMFLTPVPNQGHWVMLTYYIAQLFIISGMLKLFTERQLNQFL
ncbi:lysoplasmalogenase [Alteromonas sp. a30]|uniref:lysoplasmalogenase n=1 Tax=Alteromonas sp. a30 TaxID=2730917 RepID=UPI00227FA46D|nr:lysoplasmalogenase [Alteromonas sp. a30]MCY7294196.1 lysoplasmalogenase [Alteromonas sp. a30]